MAGGGKLVKRDQGSYMLLLIPGEHALRVTQLDGGQGEIN